jgi:DeoR/GlpR family transcriptional regulator of sugar metabolism
MPRTINKDEFALRKEALWNYLLENSERELDWKDTKALIASRTKTKVPSDPQLEYCIRQLRKELHSPNEIKIVGVDPKAKEDSHLNARIILHHRESESARREREGPEEKSRIGAAVWFTLLGRCSDDEIEPVWLVMPSQISWPSATAKKLRSLRQRTYASFAMDSGSTVRAVVRSLVNSGIMPLETFNFPEFGIPDSSANVESFAKSRSRLVLPSLITNSPLVVTDILESPNYNRMDIRLIGGSVGGDSASTNGDLAENCLAAWGYSGQFVGVDVAIVGTRGYMEDFEGQMGFMVSHLNQANMKARFFSMAATKCIVTGSDKLLNPDGVCRFARLKSDDVDLIFTDAKCLEQAAKLFIDAHLENVAVVIAATDRENADAVAKRINVLGNSLLYQGGMFEDTQNPAKMTLTRVLSTSVSNADA